MALVDKELNICWYDIYDCPHKSKVYAIDTTRDRFLVVDEDGHFEWVETEDCEIASGGK